MNRIKNIMSFLYPVMIEARNGVVTPYLEVMRSNGKYVLNSHTVNYSFGGLHIIFDNLFQKIDIKKFEFQNILILGMGAGSIISLLKDKYQIKCTITAIEKDEVVIDLSKKYFNIEKYKSLTIVHADAFDYTKVTGNKYDLIISDLFIDGDVPEIFASNEYLVNLKRISNESCCIIYNKMTDLPIHKKELIDLSEDFEQIFPGSEIHTLYANDAENSLLYYNTLPISLKELQNANVNKSAHEQLTTLKPTYTYGTNKS